MCGICGISNWKNDTVEPDLIRQMTLAIEHRGPDHRLSVSLGSTALGHARLSIIDLSESAHQPMRRANFVIVYNGEIYNYKELRTELSGMGCRFTTQSDTEVVLYAYMKWGAASFLKLNGMFAFAIWDVDTQEWILARDRMGIKPLYYYSDDGIFVFASEVKSILLAVPALDRVNLEALNEYLWYGNACDGKSLFRGVNKLKPAHYLVANRHGITVSEYWMPESNLSLTVPSFDSARRKLRDLLDKAVSDQLVSDVPLGVLLSGGIDSSAITAFASKHHATKLTTYTIHFDYDEQNSDLKRARVIAKQFQTEHHEYFVGTGQIAGLIETLIAHHDEPFADAANIPLFLITRQLSNKCKVLLQGDGGDEIFAGYRRYSILQNLRYWRALARVGRWGSIFASSPLKQRFNRLYQAVWKKDDALLMAHLLTLESDEFGPPQWINGDLAQLLKPFDPFAAYRSYEKRYGTLDLTQRMLWTDAKLLLADTFLEKVDKSSMANGVEVRVPMLDNRIVDYVMPLPANYKVRGAQKKYLLRSALRGVLPDSILDAPKAGFGVPYEKWLQHKLYEFASDVLLSKDASIFFDTRVLERMLRDHRCGKYNFGFAIWKILHLILWVKKYKMQV